MKPNADGGGNHYCMLLDDFTLSYESVKDYANMCLNADEYKNISGEEKTSLQTAINTGSEEEIFKAVSTFTSAKSAYDNYAEEAAVAEKLGLTVEAPATAAAATEALKTLNVCLLYTSCLPRRFRLYLWERHTPFGRVSGRSVRS